MLLHSLSEFCLHLPVSKSLCRARPCRVVVKRRAAPKPPFLWPSGDACRMRLWHFHDIYFFPLNSLVWGSFPHSDMPWPRSRSLSAICPPCVRCGRVSKPCPPGVAMCSDNVRLAPALCPTCIRLVCASKRNPPCARLVSICVRSGRASKPCVCHVALCVRHVSCLCPLIVRSLFALYPLFVGLCQGLWFGFGRVFVRSVFAAWSLFFSLPCPVTFSGQGSRVLIACAAHLHPVFCFPLCPRFMYLYTVCLVFVFAFSCVRILLILSSATWCVCVVLGRA